MISAILLAAGQSRRFGAPKLLEHVHGRPVVHWAAELLRRAPVDEVIVVVAPDHDGIRQALSDVDVKFVVNDRAHLGVGTSIASGAGAVHPLSDAVLIALADEPMASATSMRRVVGRYRAGGAAIVVPTYRGIRGHPVLFDRSVLPELRALEDDEGGRVVTDRDAGRVALEEIDVDAPLDLDTPRDLELLREAPPRGTLLDELMPRYDMSASHDTTVDAPVSDVYRAVLHTDLAESVASKVLMAIRSLGRRAASSFRFGELREKGAFFALANDPPREILSGVIGRFWTTDGGVIDGSRALFEAPLPAGMAKAAWGFRVDDHPAGALLTTETRVLCSDDDARRQFLRYWTLIGPFSGIIRREALRLIRAQAQFTSSSIQKTP